MPSSAGRNAGTKNRGLASVAGSAPCRTRSTKSRLANQTAWSSKESGISTWPSHSSGSPSTPLDDICRSN
eukprot:scaffold7099_cov281-Pinguiococcus_pyrenoidosus.AAC.1